MSEFLAQEFVLVMTLIVQLTANRPDGFRVPGQLRIPVSDSSYCHGVCGIFEPRHPALRLGEDICGPYIGCNRDSRYFVVIIL